MNEHNREAPRDVYGDLLVELGENDDIVVLDADLSGSTRTYKFGDEYNDRFFNMGISEQDMMGTAAGLASCGKICFVSTFAIFASCRALGQLRNSIAYPGLNVNVVATHAGLSARQDGATHQAVEDLAIMRAIPGMTVISPADSISSKKLIEQAVSIDGPVYVRLTRMKVPVIYNKSDRIKIGKANLLRQGKDITIIGTGYQVWKALKAADLLKSDHGIDAEVIDVHTVKPIDKDLITKSAKKTGCILTVEEHNVYGGLGSAVCEAVSEEYPVPIKRMGLNDHFGESGSAEQLMKKYGLTTEKIVKKAVNICKEQS